MILPTSKIERKLFIEGYDYVIGVDEVGMGCLAGPVVACAVRFDTDFFYKKHSDLDGIRDSKTLSPTQREKLAVALKKANAKFEIASCTARMIDRINILKASHQSMLKAITKLSPNKKTMILVDGNRQITGLDRPHQPITQGDRHVFSIAAASILAKVYRDRVMMRYAKKYPTYGFEKHKGYGTRYHQTQLASFGPTPIHRFSFHPVVNFRKSLRSEAAFGNSTTGFAPLVDK